MALVVVPIMAAMVLLAMDAARALPGSVGGPEGTWQGPANGQAKIAGATETSRVQVPPTVTADGYSSSNPTFSQQAAPIV